MAMVTINFLFTLLLQNSHIKGKLLKFKRITTLQIDNACSLNMYILSLGKALIFSLTFGTEFDHAYQILACLQSRLQEV